MIAAIPIFKEFVSVKQVTKLLVDTIFKANRLTDESMSYIRWRKANNKIGAIFIVVD